MTRQHFLLFIIWFGLLMSACSSEPPDPAAELHPAYSVVEQGTLSGLTLPKQLVISTMAEWQELWGVHQATRRPALPLPFIDFSTDMVIAVFLGEQPTGGHRIRIHDLVRTPTHLRVHVKIDMPDKDAVVTMALTQPYVIIKTARTRLPVEFGLDTAN